MAARSTTAGTPVKSCITTRVGMKGVSESGSPSGLQRAIASTSSFDTKDPPEFLRRASSMTRME